MTSKDQDRIAAGAIFALTLISLAAIIAGVLVSVSGSYKGGVVAIVGGAIAGIVAIVVQEKRDPRTARIRVGLFVERDRYPDEPDDDQPEP